MAARLPLMKIETILQHQLQPFRCDCYVQANRRLSIRLYQDRSDGEELTVMGITDEQCRDAVNLVRLAQELRFELYATRNTLCSNDVEIRCVD